MGAVVAGEVFQQLTTNAKPLRNIVAVADRFSGDVWLVGGVLRDFFLGITTCADFDIVTQDDPETLATALGAELSLSMFPLDSERRIFRLTGKKIVIDVALMRGTDINHDLSLRDFTVNAIALRMTRGKVVIADPYGGIADTKKGVLRPVSTTSLIDDPVRVLRAFRFMRTHALSLSGETRRSIQIAAVKLYDAPGERLQRELLHIVNSTDSHHAVNKMAREKVLDALFPELSETRGVTQNKWHHLDVFDHTLEAYRCLEKIIEEPPQFLEPWREMIIKSLAVETEGGVTRKTAVKLAALFHDTGKPATRKIRKGAVTFYCHDQESERITGKILSRLKFSNRTKNGVTKLVLHHLRPLNAISGDKGLSRRAMFRFARDLDEWTIPALLHALADGAATAGSFVTKERRADERRAVRQIMEYLAETSRAKEPLITGQDLMDNFSIAEGPAIGQLLATLDEEISVNGVTDKKNALALAEKLLENR